MKLQLRSLTWLLEKGDKLMSVKDLLRVMVVDDHVTSRMVTIDALSSLGIVNITHAKDGREAFTKLVGSPVHLIISDLYMPGVDGIQLIKAIRNHPKLGKTGAILMTGRKEDKIVRLAKEFGVNNVLGKPFTPASLKSAIESVVGRLG